MNNSTFACRQSDYHSKEFSYGSSLKNSLLETSYNTMTGTYSGLVQGATKAMLGDGIDMVPQHILGGAMSGFARTLMLNALMGAPFVASQEVRNSSVSGIIRKGGLFGLFFKRKGVTLGRNAYSGGIGAVNVQVHEFYHITDVEKMGFMNFYSRWFLESVLGILNSNNTLENNADQYEIEWMEKRGFVRY